MYLGRIVEQGATETVMTRPAHPYTRALLAAAPRAGQQSAPLAGEPPSPVNPPSGCPFRTRCPDATADCVEFDNNAVEVGPGHQVRCVHTGQQLLSLA
jgi:oligopeptide/dipeptide ABC transporter ATP-binding protein